MATKLKKAVEILSIASTAVAGVSAGVLSLSHGPSHVAQDLMLCSGDRSLLGRWLLL